jgi:hypothetical protein
LTGLTTVFSTKNSDTRAEDCQCREDEKIDGLVGLHHSVGNKSSEEVADIYILSIIAMKNAAPQLPGCQTMAFDEHPPLVSSDSYTITEPSFHFLETIFCFSIVPPLLI